MQEYGGRVKEGEEGIGDMITGLQLLCDKVN